MSTTRLLDYNPLTRIRTDWHDHADGTVTISTHQKCDDIFDANTAARLANGKGTGDLRRVASIPLVMLEQLMKEQIIDQGFKVLDQKKFLAFLNDRAFNKIRTSESRV